MRDIVGQILEVNGEKKRVSHILWDEQTIKRNVKRVAKEIAAKYGPLLEEEPSRDLVLVGILNGAIPFLDALSQELSRHLPFDRVRYDTLGISSYDETTVSGELKITKDLKDPIGGNYVIAIDDIIHTGYTSRYFVQLFKHKGAFSIEVCALVHRAIHTRQGLMPDYVAVHLTKDEFIIGYGLDWAKMGRILPCIAAIEDVKE